jgi:recombination protein RecT
MTQNLPAVATAQQFQNFLTKLKPQIAFALPKHLNADRMARLAMTAFSNTPALGECRPHTIAASIMTAAQLGLEINVNGQGYLIPYKQTCTFVPGWKGLVDLANRSGRCTVWTGAVFYGDDFDYALGDNPFIRHKPGDEDDPAKLLFVYAVGKIRGQDVPVIEVWPIRKVWKHRDRFNKVGAKHYSYQHPEMYARKIPLLQVLKYMPQSIELNAAITATEAADQGRAVTIDADWIPTTMPDDDDAGADGSGSSGGDDQGGAPGPRGDGGGAAAKPPISDADLAKKKPSAIKAFKAGELVNDFIAALETKNSLTQDQKMEVASWANEGAAQ